MKKSQKYLRLAALFYSLFAMLVLGVFFLLYAFPIDKIVLIFLAIIGVALWILASIMRTSYRQALKEEKVEEIEQFRERMEKEMERIKKVLDHIDGKD